MKPVVEVQNLSKLFHLGSIGATSLRDSMERVADVHKRELERRWRRLVRWRRQLRWRWRVG